MERGATIKVGLGIHIDAASQELLEALEVALGGGLEELNGRWFR